MYGTRKDVTDNLIISYKKHYNNLLKNKNPEIMRTIENNRITRKLNAPNGYTWNSKRRYR